jgi:hypothetical protein
VARSVPVATTGGAVDGDSDGVLHEEEWIGSVPRRENGDGEHLAHGSPKSGDPRRRYGDAVVLRCSPSGTVGSVSSSDDWGCSWTCCIRTRRVRVRPATIARDV